MVHALRPGFLAGKIWHFRRLFLIIALGCSWSACGPRHLTQVSQSHSDPLALQNFEDWCGDWSINCPSNQPKKDFHFDSTQWLALSEVLQEFLASKSSFQFDTQDFASSELKNAMQTLDQGALYQDIKQRLVTNQWLSLALEHGSLVQRHTAGYREQTEEGVRFNIAPMQSFQISQIGAISNQGLSLSSETAQASSEFKSMQIEDHANFRLNFSDRVVEHVPQEFALGTLLFSLGLDVHKINDSPIESRKLIAAAGPFITWLNSRSRVLELDQQFFKVASKNLAAIIPKSDLGLNLGNLLAGFKKMKTSPNSKNSLVAISVSPGLVPQCDLNNGDMRLNFAPEFGVRRSYQADAETLGIEFYGLEANIKIGFGINFEIKRIEISPEYLSLLDVPVMGKIDIKWDDLSKAGEKISLSCAS